MCVCACITLPPFIYSTDSAGNGRGLCTLKSEYLVFGCEKASELVGLKNAQILSIQYASLFVFLLCLCSHFFPHICFHPPSPLTHSFPPSSSSSSTNALCFTSVCVSLLVNVVSVLDSANVQISSPTSLPWDSRQRNWRECSEIEPRTS